MECPCHEGHFDATTGAVLEGPPQRPLGRIDVEVRNGTVWALGTSGEVGEIGGGGEAARR
jgi:Rieske Fe-S protein